MATKLKCQFCVLDFSSVYKIIPHIYFGHRKKISRISRDHQEIKLSCPSTGCDFSHCLPVLGVDLVFPTLSDVFLVLEEHILSTHFTHEDRLTSCPYCNKSLEHLVYWEHLEEHMGSQMPKTPPAKKSNPNPISSSPISMSTLSRMSPAKTDGQVTKDNSEVISTEAVGKKLSYSDENKEDINIQPTDDIMTNKQPTYDVNTNKQPTDNVNTNKQPTDDVITNKKPTDDVNTNKQSTDDDDQTFKMSTEVESTLLSTDIKQAVTVIENEPIKENQQQSTTDGPESLNKLPFSDNSMDSPKTSSSTETSSLIIVKTISVEDSEVSEYKLPSSKMIDSSVKSNYNLLQETSIETSELNEKNSPGHEESAGVEAMTSKETVEEDISAIKAGNENLTTKVSETNIICTTDDVESPTLIPTCTSESSSPETAPRLIETPSSTSDYIPGPIDTISTTWLTEISKVPTETTICPAGVPLSPNETQTSLTDTKTIPTKTPSSLTDTPTSPNKTPTSQIETLSSSTETLTGPTETLTGPTETPTSPTKTLTSPTETASNQIETPTSPTETPNTSLTEATTSPIETPISQTEIPKNKKIISSRDTVTFSTETPISLNEDKTSPRETMTSAADTIMCLTDAHRKEGKLLTRQSDVPTNSSEIHEVMTSGADLASSLSKPTASNNEIAGKKSSPGIIKDPSALKIDKRRSSSETEAGNKTDDSSGSEPPKKKSKKEIIDRLKEIERKIAMKKREEELQKSIDHTSPVPTTQLTFDGTETKDQVITETTKSGSLGEPENVRNLELKSNSDVNNSQCSVMMEKKDDKSVDKVHSANLNLKPDDPVVDLKITEIKVKSTTGSESPKDSISKLRKSSQERETSRERDRFSSGDSQPDKPRRLSGSRTQTEKVVKSKPVLTEEMERKIIYGSFKKKESRSEKLTAVKREIESRFKEEETRRNREREERWAREEKEREKERNNQEKLRLEREKLKEERRKLEEVEKAVAEERLVEQPLDEDEEDESDECGDENFEVSSPVPQNRDKSPDQYERIKLEIQKIDTEIEKKENARKLAARRASSDKQVASPKPDETGEEKLSEEVKATLPVVPETSVDMSAAPSQSHEEDPDDEMDDFEAMMRDFQEKESQEMVPTEQIVVVPPKVVSTPSDSLSLLRDSYGSKKARSPSPTIPSGFDKDGHPLVSVPTNTGSGSNVLVRAATNAARGIMGPAPRPGSGQLQLQCSLCKEEGPSAGYSSAYQLLSHVFLAHRKKIVSRSRKARGMTLACPEGCGYVTKHSASGVSIDFFHNQLPIHLASLADHVVSKHTLEEILEVCPHCQLPLSHKEAWSWQHLANHRDARRVFCLTCNTFPFKTEVHRCPGLEDSSPSRKSVENKGKSLEEIAREVESGSLDQRHLGELTLWGCRMCTKEMSSLSKWISHIKDLHLTEINSVVQLKCFCCTWLPTQSDTGIVMIDQMVTHMVREHKHQSWEDKEIENERRSLDKMAMEHIKRVERTKEEADIHVPLLPYPCPSCNLQIDQTEAWKYHKLAHKYGEVFCSLCCKWFVGFKFSDHQVQCRQNKVEVRGSEFDEEADKKALMDIFKQLIWIDKENDTKHVLTVDDTEYPVETGVRMAKDGSLYSRAMVKVGDKEYINKGDSGLTAVQGIINQLDTRKDNFCCVHCGTKFAKEITFKMHKQINCQT